MKRSIGYAPSHITAFFSIEDQASDELAKGSRGAGFCLSAGVKTLVQEGKEESSIFINGQSPDNPRVTLQLLKIFREDQIHQKIDFKKLDNIEIYHEITMPEGSGFGTSGAGALSLAHALNDYFSLEMAPLKLAQLAHRAEIRAKTGLGTIAGEFLGGVEVRESAGAPGIGTIRPIPFPESLRCHILYQGKILTHEALSDPKIRKTVIEAGNRALLHPKTILSWEEMMKRAHQFTKECQLLPPPLANLFLALKENGIDGAMLMFGKGIHFLYLQEDKEIIKKTLNKIRNLGYTTDCTEYDFSIDPTGGRLLK